MSSSFLFIFLIAMLRHLHSRVAPTPADDVPFVVDPVYSLRGVGDSHVGGIKRRHFIGVPPPASSSDTAAAAARRPKKLININACERCYLCERPRRPRPVAAGAGGASRVDEPRAWWPWTRNLLLTPFHVLKSYSFFKPLEDVRHHE